MDNVLDLDILRPDKKLIKLNGKTFDVSFIPLGITFEVDDIIRELGGIKQQDVGEDKEKTKKAFELTVKLCSVFASYKNPEMTPEWFLDNVSANQINEFAAAIKDALIVSYKGVEQYGKN